VSALWPKFLWLLPLAALPIILYLLRRNKRTATALPSLVLLDEERPSRTFDEELLKVIYQTLLLLGLVLVFAEPGCRNQRTAADLPAVLLVDDRFPSSAHSQGMKDVRSRIRELASNLDLTAYSMTELITTSSLKELDDSLVWKSEPWFLSSLPLADRLLSGLLPGQHTVHYLSAFCEEGTAIPKIDQLKHDWRFHKLAGQSVWKNAWFESVSIQRDWQTAGRYFINASVQGEDVQLRLYLKDQLRQESSVSSNIQIPFIVPEKNTLVKGYLELIGDNLTWDNRYYFAFRSFPELELVLHGIGPQQRTILGSVFPSSQSGGSFRLRDSSESASTSGRKARLYYGEQQGQLPKGSLHLFHSQEEEESATGAWLAEPLTNKLYFPHVLRGITAEEVLLSFTDGTPAVLSLGGNSLKVLFDIFSIEGNDLYNLAYPELWHLLIDELFWDRAVTVFRGTEAAFYLGTSAAPGIHSGKEGPLVFNADPRLSACRPLDESLLAELPGPASRQVPALPLFGIWLAFLAGYLIVFHLRRI
jgi:hypothetical protein